MTERETAAEQAGLKDVAGLPPAEYRAARQAMTRASEQVARQGRPSSFTGDARTLSRQEYAAARQDFIRSVGR